MGTYTATEIKDLTSINTISNWSDSKILLKQTMAESILNSLDLDSSVSGYTDAYNSAVIALIDWIADNPTGLEKISMGKVSKSFVKENLPNHIHLLLKRFVEGDDGMFTPAVLERKDIGRR